MCCEQQDYFEEDLLMMLRACLPALEGCLGYRGAGRLRDWCQWSAPDFTTEILSVKRIISSTPDPASGIRVTGAPSLPLFHAKGRQVDRARHHLVPVLIRMEMVSAVHVAPKARWIRWITHRSVE